MQAYLNIKKQVIKYSKKAHDEEAYRRKATQLQTLQLHFLWCIANSHDGAHWREALYILNFDQCDNTCTDLKFVTTVPTSGPVKFFPAVKNFPENNAFPCKICVKNEILSEP